MCISMQPDGRMELLRPTAVQERSRHALARQPLLTHVTASTALLSSPPALYPAGPGPSSRLTPAATAPAATTLASPSRGALHSGHAGDAPAGVTRARTSVQEHALRRLHSRPPSVATSASAYLLSVRPRRVTRSWTPTPPRRYATSPSIRSPPPPAKPGRQSGPLAFLVTRKELPWTKTLTPSTGSKLCRRV